MSSEPRSKKTKKTSPAPGDDARRNAPATAALIILAVGLAAICGLCGGAMYLFQPKLSDDPRAVTPLMDELLEIDIPAAFEPRGTIEWNMAFMLTLQGAYFETSDRSQDGVLMFLGVEGGSLDKPNVRQHVERVLSEKSNGTVQLTPEGSPEERMVQVRGQSVPFTFETGVDPGSKQRYRLMHGVVDAPTGGEVLIALRIRTGPHWDDAVALRMLESIR